MQCCAPVNPNVLFNGSCNTLLFLIFLHLKKNKETICTCMF